MATFVSVQSRNILRTKPVDPLTAEVATFSVNDANFERAIDLIAKFDCYGIGPKMVETFGNLQNFFEDSEVGTPPVRIVLSNNTMMVVFGIVSELLAMKTAELRMTHARILHKRKTVKDDPTIGSNMRSDVIYNDVAMLSKLQSILTDAIYSGDSLILVETEVHE